jgi:hypothetical protein
MNFVQLVNDVLLKESPDSLSFGGKRLAYDAPQGNPITFFVDYLNYSKGTYKFHKANLGLVVVYSKRNVRVSHTELEDILFNFNFEQLQEREWISFFSPDLNVEERLSQLHRKYPTMSITTNLNREDMSEAQQGRMWRIKDKVIIALWENDQKFIEKYVIPFAQHVYPDVRVENIYVEDSNNPSTFHSGSRSNKTDSESEPYQKELINLQKQLHLASGDEKKRRKVKQQIKDICLNHNLDPKKYGISDEELKGSELTAQKILGQSKETMASLKNRMQTSESKSL